MNIQLDLDEAKSCAALKNEGGKMTWKERVEIGYMIAGAISAVGHCVGRRTRCDRL